MNKIVEEQLKKSDCDLSHFDSATNTYFIPKKNEIKVEEDNSYLVHCKPTLFQNQTLKINWNSGSLPNCEHLIVYITKLMGKTIKVDAVGFDVQSKQDTDYRWTGWLTLPDIEVIQKM